MGTAIKPSPTPFRAFACQADHGATTVIVDAVGFEVAKINSPAWDDKATLEYPQDRANLAFILSACNDALLNDAITLLRRLKSDLMSARRFQPDTLHTYRRACTSAEGDIELFLNEIKELS